MGLGRRYKDYLVFASVLPWFNADALGNAYFDLDRSNSLGYSFSNQTYKTSLLIAALTMNQTEPILASLG